MNNLFYIAVLIILSILVYVLYQEIKRQKKNKPKHKLDKSLDKQLLTMLNSDRKAALRLLRHARKRNPNRTYLWYHEKVIRDLERDRRS